MWLSALSCSLRRTINPPSTHPEHPGVMFTKRKKEPGLKSIKDTGGEEGEETSDHVTREIRLDVFLFLPRHVMMSNRVRHVVYLNLDTQLHVHVPL